MKWRESRRTGRALMAGLLAISALGANAEVALPHPDLDGLEPGVHELLRTAREVLLSGLESSELRAIERGQLYGHTGEVFHAHHVFAVAQACYENASELDPQEVLWPYFLGYLYEDTARYTLAKTAYRRVLELDTEHDLATLRLARVLLEEGDVEEAAELLARLDPESDLAAPIHAALGKLATAGGAHAEAAAHYAAALEAQPEATQLHSPLALAYRRAGQVEKAREHAALVGPSKLILPDPILDEMGSLSVSSQMFLTSGAQALKAERFDLAEKAFRSAIAVNPENKRAHLNLAVVLANRGELLGAEESAREALRLDPEYGFAYFNLGTVFEARGQIGEAMDFYRNALTRNSDDLKAHFRLANLLMRTEEYEAAARHYRAAIETSPSFMRARYLEALAWIAVQRYTTAREVLEEAVEIQPENDQLTGSLVRLLATSKPPTEADGARALRLARTLDRDNAEDIETLALALAAAGEFDQAVSAQEAVVDAARGQASPDLLRHLEYNLERYRHGQPSDRPWP